WLYALVAKTDGGLDGAYVTKDFGQNWTKIRIPVTTPANLFLNSNDINLSDNNIFGPQGGGGQGNFDMSLAVDPTNPAIIYLGGHTFGLIRVDSTFVHDAHAFFEDSALGSGEYIYNVNDPVVLKGWPDGGRNTFYPNAVDNPYINLVRDPENPFLANA